MFPSGILAALALGVMRGAPLPHPRGWQCSSLDQVVSDARLMQDHAGPLNASPEMKFRIRQPRLGIQAAVAASHDTTGASSNKLWQKDRCHWQLRIKIQNISYLHQRACGKMVFNSNPRALLQVGGCTWHLAAFAVFSSWNTSNDPDKKLDAKAGRPLLVMVKD